MDRKCSEFSIGWKRDSVNIIKPSRYKWIMEKVLIGNILKEACIFTDYKAGRYVHKGL